MHRNAMNREKEKRSGADFGERSVADRTFVYEIPRNAEIPRDAMEINAVFRTVPRYAAPAVASRSASRGLFKEFHAGEIAVTRRHPRVTCVPEITQIKRISHSDLPSPIFPVSLGPSR